MVIGQKHYSYYINTRKLSIPIYCLIRERTNDYLDKKIINFSESEKSTYSKFSKIWKSLFKIDIFEFRKLIKNELVLPKILKCGFDKIFYSIDEYLTYIENNNLELPENFDILPDSFQEDIKNMIELYKTLL